MRAPPPPSDPAPPNQPMIHSAFRLPPIGGGEYPSEVKRLSGNRLSGTEGTDGQVNLAAKPPPPIKKPVAPALPKVKVLYDYNPQDLDELALREGDVVEVLKERESPFFFFFLAFQFLNKFDLLDWRFNFCLFQTRAVGGKDD